MVSIAANIGKEFTRKAEERRASVARSADEPVMPSVVSPPDDHIPPGMDSGDPDSRGGDIAWKYPAGLPEELFRFGKRNHGCPSVYPDMIRELYKTNVEM